MSAEPFFAVLVPAIVLGGLLYYSIVDRRWERRQMRHIVQVHKFMLDRDRNPVKEDRDWLDKQWKLTSE